MVSRRYVKRVLKKLERDEQIDTVDYIASNIACLSQDCWLDEDGNEIPPRHSFKLPAETE